jgi:site-specific DNA recombinase
MIAAIYARKSNAESVDEKDKSVARQIEDARAYARKKGWTVDDAHVYVDDGISGVEFARRPGFMRLMAAVAEKPRPFDALVMWESERLGREQIETAWVMHQIIGAGVRIFFYTDDRELELDTPLKKFLMNVETYRGEAEREKTRSRISSGMRSHARHGHWTGGNAFGYTRVPILSASGERSHVELRINDAEAPVVKRIFAMCAAGKGLKATAHALNVDQAPCPNPQQGRPKAWSVPTVRGVLHRDLYRGRVVWNRRQAHGAGGKCVLRPESEWVTTPAPQLRIVTDAQWDAAHARIEATAATYGHESNGKLIGRPSTGLAARHLLTGLSACGICGGGFMRRVYGASRGRRMEVYLCTQYHNKGATVCANNLPLLLQGADAAVLGKLRDYVLRPDIVEGAIMDAVAALRPSADVSEKQRARLTRELAKAKGEAANLAAAIARGGDMAPLLDALKARQADQARLQRELDGLDGLRQLTDFDVRKVERELRKRLADWRGLLGRQTAVSRQIVAKLVSGRLVFTPQPDRSWTFTGQVQFGKLFKGIVLPSVFERSTISTLRRQEGPPSERARGPMPADWRTGRHSRKDSRRATCWVLSAQCLVLVQCCCSVLGAWCSACTQHRHPAPSTQHLALAPSTWHQHQAQSTSPS